LKVPVEASQLARGRAFFIGGWEAGMPSVWKCQWRPGNSPEAATSYRKTGEWNTVSTASPFLRE
jgi:hypothetical protein